MAVDSKCILYETNLWLWICIISKRRSRRNVWKIVMDIRENGSIFILLRMDKIRPYCCTSLEAYSAFLMFHIMNPWNPTESRRDLWLFIFIFILLFKWWILRQFLGCLDNLETYHLKQKTITLSVLHFIQWV